MSLIGREIYDPRMRCVPRPAPGPPRPHLAGTAGAADVTLVLGRFADLVAATPVVERPALLERVSRLFDGSGIEGGGGPAAGTRDRTCRSRAGRRPTDSRG